MTSILDIQKDINNSRACKKSTINHYSILLDYIITDDYDFTDNHDIIDVERILFDWYKHYDASEEYKYDSQLVQLINGGQSIFQYKNFLPLDLNHYIFLRAIKFYQLYPNQIEKFEVIFQMILDTYCIDLKAKSTLLSGLVQPFIEYTKLSRNMETSLNIFEFIEPENVDSIVSKILKLMLHYSENEYNINNSPQKIFDKVLYPFFNYNVLYQSKCLPNIHNTIMGLLQSNVKSIDFSFISKISSLIIEDTPAVSIDKLTTFVTENMDVLPFTLYEINEFYNSIKENTLEFKFFNKHMMLEMFKKDYLPILNMLKTKNIKLAHQFLKKGSVQMESFNQLLIDNPAFVKKNQHLVLEKFDRIPEKYVLKKLLNMHGSDDADTHLFSKDLVDEKFWDNFNQANTCSKTNKYLTICFEVAMQLSDYHVELINILHMFPVHFKPNHLFNITLEELTSILVVESKMNVIESFNLIKKLLEILLSISKKPLNHLKYSDEEILVVCQSTYINEIDDLDNIEYLESSIFDFINLLSEFEELKYMFYDTKKYDTLWLRVVHFVREKKDDEIFFKVMLMIPKEFKKNNGVSLDYINRLLI